MRTFFLVISLIFISYSALGFVTAALGPSIPALGAQTNTTISGVASIFIARYLGYLIGVMVYGHLFDRLSAKRLITTATLGMAIGMFLVPHATQIYTLFLIIGVLGIAQGGIDLGGILLIFRLTGKNAQPYINGLNFSFGVGAVLAPILIEGTKSRTASLEPAFTMIGLIICAITLALLLPPEIYRDSKPPSENHSPTSTSSRLILGISIFYFFYIGAEASFGGWIYTYIINTPYFNLVDAAVTTSLFWFAITLGRLMIIPLSKKIPPKYIICFALLIVAFIQSILIVGPSTMMLIRVGVFATGFFMSVVFPGMLNYANQYLSISGKKTGVFLFGSNAGAMAIPFIAGQVLSKFGDDSLFLVILICLAFAGIAFVMLSKLK